MKRKATTVQGKILARKSGDVWIYDTLVRVDGRWHFMACGWDPSRRALMRRASAELQSVDMAKRIRALPARGKAGKKR